MSARVVAALLLDQVMEDRQEEGGGLAASGHRAGEDVAGLERRRDRVGLDRRGTGEPHLAHPANEIGM